VTVHPTKSSKINDSALVPPESEPLTVNAPGAVTRWAVLSAASTCHAGAVVPTGHARAERVTGDVPVTWNSKRSACEVEVTFVGRRRSWTRIDSPPFHRRIVRLVFASRPNRSVAK